MANEEQLRILNEEGIEAWNKWRDRNPGTRPNLRGANFRKKDFSGADSNGFCGSTILKGLAPIHRASNQQIMKPVVMIAKTIEIGKRRHPFGAV